MKIRTAIATFAAAGAMLTAPAFAQQGNEAAPGEADQILRQEQAQQKGASLTVSPAVVRQIEQALNNAGYDAGPIDGTWDQAGERAMANFQQAQGLEPTGQINQRSLAALNVQIQPGAAVGGGAAAGLGEQELGGGSVDQEEIGAGGQLGGGLGEEEVGVGAGAGGGLGEEEVGVGAGVGGGLGEEEALGEEDQILSQEQAGLAEEEENLGVGAEEEEGGFFE